MPHGSGMSNSSSSVLQAYNEMFNDASPERTERMSHYLDPANTGYVDYLGWSQSMRLQVPVI